MNTSNEIIIAPEVAMALLKEENISVNLDEVVAIIHLLTQLEEIEVKERSRL